MEYIIDLAKLQYNQFYILSIICRNKSNFNHFLVKTIKSVWWQSLRDQFRTNYKLERERKSGSEGGDAKGKAITWVFYKEMAFMKKFVYTRPYVAFTLINNMRKTYSYHSLNTIICRNCINI